MEEKKVNILLIHPPFKHNLNHLKQSAVIRPMGLAYLASYLRKYQPNVNVRILDAHALDLSVNGAVKKILQKKWDIIGFSFWTAQALSTYSIADKIKLRLGNNAPIIVFGGVHPTSMPDEASEHCDYIFIGEAEETLLEFVNNYIKNKSNNKILGIAYRKGKKLIINARRPFIKDIDKIPFPALDLLPMKRYNTGVGENDMHVTRGEMVPIFGSRGCPYNCSFCVSPFFWQRNVRFRSPKNIVDEMEWIVKKFKINKFHFWDDNFMMKRDWVEELCNEIINRKIKIYWTGLTRAEHLNKHKDLLLLMKKSGCVGIEIGIESANPETYKAVNKGQTIDDTENALKNQRKVCLEPLFTSMTFNIGETINGYYLQNNFMNDCFQDGKFSKIYIGQFATPYPRTKFLEEAKKNGLILAEDWNDYTHFSINFIPYSVLNDYPIKNIKKLRIEDHFFVIKQGMNQLYHIFPRTDSVFAKIKKILNQIKINSYFIALCNGKNTVLDIGKKIQKRFKLPFKEAMQITGFIVASFAQSGVVKSLKDKNINIKVKSLINSYYFIYMFRNILNFPLKKLKLFSAGV